MNRGIGHTLALWMAWPHFIHDTVLSYAAYAWHWSKPACRLCKHRHALASEPERVIGCTLSKGEPLGWCSSFVPGKGSICDDHCGIPHERGRCSRCNTIRYTDAGEPFECRCKGVS